MSALVVAKLCGLIAAYGVGLCLGTLLHELGHAVAALVATRQRIALELGRGPGFKRLQLGRLGLALGPWRLWHGATRYDRRREPRGVQALVALAGPVASLAALAGGVIALQRWEIGSWLWVAALGFAAANFRILLVALWPIAYRPDGAEGEVWLSDGLDLWRLWRR